MARYPTFEEYQKTGKYADGIRRCDELLARNARNAQLLTVKLRLQSAIGRDGTPTLEQLVALQPPLTDTRAILAIEEAAFEAQRDVFPLPRTAGPLVAKVYENAARTMRGSGGGLAEQQVNLQTLRFTTAIYDDRLADAQQALIQLKVLQPRNRVVYMAHAAVTQLLSTASDDLQSRLAGSLARKAVADRFDTDSALDCRVAGQILALQGRVEEVRSLQGSFRESKQVFDLLNHRQTGEPGGSSRNGGDQDKSKLNPAERLTAEVNEMKETFATLITTAAPIPALLSFAVVAIQRFRAGSQTLGKGKGGRTTIDACFLAISALVRAFQLSGNNSHLLQATYLAESLLHHDTHVHESRIVLVYLYMRLGLGSCAMRLFESLSVKEIQHDTVGHVLLTDISYIHPHGAATTKRDAADPFKRATHALNVYTRHEEKLAETEAAALTHGQTGMILDVHELRGKLRASLTRRLICLEQRRLARLVHGKEGEDSARLGPRVLAAWLAYSDNRDFHATFDFGYNVEEVLHGRDGRLPGRQWLLFGLAVDAAWCLARGLPTPVIDIDTLIDELSGLSSGLESLALSDTGEKRKSLTTRYDVAADLACQVLALLHRGAKTSGDVDAVAAALQRLDVDALFKTTDGLGDTIKEQHAYLDVLAVTARACQTVAPRAGEHAGAITALQARARGLVATLQSQARDRAKRLSAESVGKALEAEAEVWQALKTFGEGAAKAFCASVAESAREGWEGLGRLKVV